MSIRLHQAGDLSCLGPTNDSYIFFRSNCAAILSTFVHAESCFRVCKTPSVFRDKSATTYGNLISPFVSSFYHINDFTNSPIVVRCHVYAVADKALFDLMLAFNWQCRRVIHLTSEVQYTLGPLHNYLDTTCSVNTLSGWPTSAQSTSAHFGIFNAWIGANLGPPTTCHPDSRCIS